MKFFALIFLTLAFFSVAAAAVLTADSNVFDRVDQSNIGFRDNVKHHRNQHGPLFPENPKPRFPRNSNNSDRIQVVKRRVEELISRRLEH